MKCHKILLMYIHRTGALTVRRGIIWSVLIPISLVLAMVSGPIQSSVNYITLATMASQLTYGSAAVIFSLTWYMTAVIIQKWLIVAIASGRAPVSVYKLGLTYTSIGLNSITNDHADRSPSDLDLHVDDNDYNAKSNRSLYVHRGRLFPRRSQHLFIILL